MTDARVLSVAVGRPRDVAWRDDVVRTCFFKTPVTGRAWVGPTNIVGDEQADLTFHGGPEKAVYLYASEHYPLWQRDLGLTDLPWASFGENLTTTGLRESVVNIGDRYRMGSAVFIVTQARMPCFKMNIRFGRDDMVRRFRSEDRSGFYLGVEEEGEIGAGDSVELVERDARGLTVAEAFRLKVGGGPPDRLELAASHPALAAGWRESFRRQLESQT